MPDDREALIARAEQLDELVSRRCEQELATFVKAAWHVLEPSRPLVWTWHMDLICGELEEVTAGRTKQILINIPPGTMKTYLASVFWPAWEWGPRRMPHLRYMCASHEQSLSTRDNMRVRDLVQSGWYQTRWPLGLREEQNQKTRFDTDAGGWRIGTSVGGRGMGEHPHRRIGDDLHDPRRAPTELERETVWHWYTQLWAGRGAVLDAADVVIGQRLHEDDISGRLQRHESFGKQRTFVHIVLPMRYVPPQLQDDGQGGKVLVPVMKTTPRGGRDARTVPGELLCQALLPANRVDINEALLDEDGTAAQHQQQPGTGKGGGRFKREWFPILDVLPADVVKWVRCWDVAGTVGGTGSRTAGCLMGVRAGGSYVLTDPIAGRWEDDEVDRVIAQTARTDGPEVAIREEQEGGSAGKAVVRLRARRLPGYDYMALNVSKQGDKTQRSRAFRAQSLVGNVSLVARTDDERRRVREWLDEVCAVSPRLKDQLDAASGAFNCLLEMAGGVPLDIVTGPRPDSEMTEAERLERDERQREAGQAAVDAAIRRDGIFWPGGLGRR